MPNSFKFLFNKLFFLATLFLALQQIIVASSTLWVSQLAKEVAQEADFTLTLILFISSLIVVYIPGSCAIIIAEKAQLFSTKKYIDTLFSVCFGKILSRNNQLKDEITPIASSENFVIFDDASKLLFDLLSLLMNITFNMIVLSIVIEKEIIIYYILGLILSTTAVLVTSHHINRLSTNFQISITEIKGIIYKFWDNLFLGNKYNYKLYKKEYNQHFHIAISNKIKSTIINNIASSLGMLLMILPVSGYLFSFIINGTHSTESIIVLVATLPRQLMMMQFAYAAISQSIHFIDNLRCWITILRSKKFPLMKYLTELKKIK